MPNIPGTNREIQQKHLDKSHSVLKMDGILRIPLHQIELSPKQNRKNYTNESIEKMARSLQSSGQLQPGGVRLKAGTTAENPIFILIYGQRRFFGAQKAGMKYYEAKMVSNPIKSDRWANYAENKEREDFTPFEEAEFFMNAMKEDSLKQNELAKRVGMTQSRVSELTSLLSIPHEIREEIEKYRRGDIPVKTLIRLAKIKIPAKIFRPVQVLFMR